MAGQQFPTTKEVKCEYEWIILHTLKNGVTSPQFSSQSEGLRKLNWRIELIRTKKGGWEYLLGLRLLTDIEDEIVINYSYSIKVQASGSIISMGSSNFKFNRSNMNNYCLHNLLILDLWANGNVPLKNKWEIRYMDVIRGIPSSEVNQAIKEFKNFGINDEKYLAELSENFSNLLKNPEFTDVTLCVRGKEFRAHKAILSTRSLVFAAMFKHETKEKLENRVEIQDLEPETVQEMLNFIYTGSAPNLPKMAEELLAAADRYELKSLMTMAEKQLIPNISLDNAIKLLVLADMHSFAATNLYNAAIEFVVANVKKLKLTEDWKMMVENKPRLMDPIMNEVVKRLP